MSLLQPYIPSQIYTWWKRNHWVQQCIDMISSQVWEKLSLYENCIKVLISLNGEKKEIHLMKDNFSISSEGWEEINISWIIFKVNPENDIIEYTQWDLKWEQLFTWGAANRELSKIWYRLPYAEKWKLEFQEIIHTLQDNTIFTQKFPGYVEINRKKNWIRQIWESVFYWCWSVNLSLSSNIEFNKTRSDFFYFWNHQWWMYSVRWIKEANNPYDNEHSIVHYL